MWYLVHFAPGVSISICLLGKMHPRHIIRVYGPLFGSHILIMPQHELTKAEFISAVGNFTILSARGDIFEFSRIHRNEIKSWTGHPKFGCCY